MFLSLIKLVNVCTPYSSHIILLKYVSEFLKPCRTLWSLCKKNCRNNWSYTFSEFLEPCCRTNWSTPSFLLSFLPLFPLLRHRCCCCRRCSTLVNQAQRKKSERARERGSNKRETRESLYQTIKNLLEANQHRKYGHRGKLALKTNMSLSPWLITLLFSLFTD